MGVRCSWSNLCTHVHFYMHPLTHILINSSTLCPFFSSLMPTLWLQFSSAERRKVLQSRGNRYMTTVILCSVITQNLHCWVGFLHWFLQKYLLQQEHRCKAKFCGSAFSVHWFQNNNQFHTVQCFNTFIQRLTSTQTGTCAYSVLFPSVFLFPCSKKPKDSQSNCSQICSQLLAADCPNKSHSSLATLKYLSPSQ